jgi:sugar phosphate permease
VLAQAAFAALAFLPIAAFTATAAPGVALAIAAVFPASMALAQLHLVFTVSRMGWASASQAGTDFTIHGAFYNIGRTLAAAAVGFVAAAFGWAGFFLALAAVIVGICAVYAAGFAALTRAVEAREARLALRPNEATS